MIVFVVLLFVVVSMPSVAQESIDKSNGVRQMKTPRLSINADFSVRPGGYYYVTKDDAIIESGNSGAFSKASVKASYAFLSKGATRLSVNAGYSHLRQEYDGIVKTVDHGLQKKSHHYMSCGLMGMTRLKLWNKPLMVVAFLNTDLSENGYERWSAMGTAMLMLKQTRDTQLGVGVVGLIHMFSKIPIILMASYRHVFNPHWTINLTLPR